MLTWRILMLTLRILMLTLRKLICKDTDANILLVTQQTFLISQDVFKTSWRRLQRNTFCLPWPLLKTSSRRLQDVFAMRFPKMSLRRLQESSRRHQDVFARRLAIMSSRRLGRQKNVTAKTSWRCLEDVFSTSSPRRMFAG